MYRMYTHKSPPAPPLPRASGQRQAGASATNIVHRSHDATHLAARHLTSHTRPDRRPIVMLLSRLSVYPPAPPTSTASSSRLSSTVRVIEPLRRSLAASVSAPLPSCRGAITSSSPMRSPIARAAGEQRRQGEHRSERQELETCSLNGETSFWSKSGCRRRPPLNEAPHHCTILSIKHLICSEQLRVLLRHPAYMHATHT